MLYLKQVFIATLLVALISYPTGYFSFAEHLNRHQQLVLHKHQHAKLARYDKQMLCLRQALWFEARGESELGMRAVATVIINRVKRSKHPSDFCRVIHAVKQFSYTHQLKIFAINPGTSEVKKLMIVDKIIGEVYTSDFFGVLPEDVLWYCSVRVNPSWAAKKKLVALIGNHKFYRS